eukprot:352511-Chlamydomonas_euryale.AAC.2
MGARCGSQMLKEASAPHGQRVSDSHPRMQYPFGHTRMLYPFGHTRMYFGISTTYHMELPKNRLPPTAAQRAAIGGSQHGAGGFRCCGVCESRPGTRRAQAVGLLRSCRRAVADLCWSLEEAAAGAGAGLSFWGAGATPWEVFTPKEPLRHQLLEALPAVVSVAAYTVGGCPSLMLLRHGEWTGTCVWIRIPQTFWNLLGFF